MKIKVPLTVSNTEDWKELQKYSAQCFGQIIELVNGKLNFGENIETSLKSVEFKAANTTVSVDHNLGRVPGGYILAGATVSMNIFNGATANNDTKLYLQASAAGTASVLIF